jgi:uncharacterized membrane protein YczE
VSLKKRYSLFVCGLFFMSLGICLIIKSALGTSPISSIPYILSLQYPLTLGEFTFIINMLFLLLQVLILRRQFPAIQFLQIPMTVIFSCFIDVVMFLLTDLNPVIYPAKMLTLLLGCCALAMGVALQIIGNVVMLAGEGLVYTIIKYWKFNLAHTKTLFDTCLVIVSVILSFLYFNEIRGIREGTFISAFAVGSIARFYIQHLSFINDEGHFIFCLPFTVRHATKSR